MIVLAHLGVLLLVAALLARLPGVAVGAVALVALLAGPWLVTHAPVDLLVDEGLLGEAVRFAVGGPYRLLPMVLYAALGHRPGPVAAARRRPARPARARRRRCRTARRRGRDARSRAARTRRPRPLLRHAPGDRRRRTGGGRGHPRGPRRRPLARPQGTPARGRGGGGRRHDPHALLAPGALAGVRRPGAAPGCRGRLVDQPRRPPRRVARRDRRRGALVVRREPWRRGPLEGLVDLAARGPTIQP